MLLPGFSLATGLLRISLRHLFVWKIIPGLFSQSLLDNLVAGIEAPDVGDAIFQPINSTLGATNSSLVRAQLGSTWEAARSQANDFVSSILDTFRDTVAASQPSASDISGFIETHLLPPITLSMSLQTCYLGSDKVGPFDLGSQQLAPLSLHAPCNLIAPIGGPEEGSIGKVVEDLVGIFVAGDSLLHIALLAILWPLMAVLLEMLIQSPGLSKHFVPKDEVPAEQVKPQSSVDADVQAEQLRVAELSPKRQIILVRGLRRVYKRPNAVIVGALGACVLGGVGLMLGLRCSLYLILAVAAPLLASAVLLSRFWAPAIYWRVRQSTHAVRGVSWASDTGMVFGLLGVNGAGKTSTFEMMSGLLTPSAGEVTIVGMNVLTQVEACRRYIGYCPQFDCILPCLTPEDHLYLFGRMKGLRDHSLEAAVEQKLSEMQLAEYRDRHAGTLSGGNKRKLSVAIALIGEPPIVFLDEPSTGMDPFARRFMWKVIDDVAERRKKSVVVLTTHSMEEGEALCSKIAIQVDGQLGCFGSVQQVKDRYGTGYEVPVKFKPVSDAQRRAVVPALEARGLRMGAADILEYSRALSALSAGESAEKFGRASGDGAPFSQGTTQVPFGVFVDWWILDALVCKLQKFLSEKGETTRVVLLEHHGLSARFRLPELVESSRLSTLLEGLLADKTLNLDDFALCQSSLEQVFNEFARRGVQAGQQAEMAKDLRGSVGQDIEHV